MRIQHNIMAMSAYRNYTNNVSAMKKNLEKLSSGYKINRAGDDAAGLAISEKMRAQITGLETAQKNAKDGISLVQTAEGALTEVHDMLNRMVELATQSANGTYDDTTDRFQLQKEMDQLKSEIDRIADSANFNGIKLLNGDMDGTELKTEDVTTQIKGVFTEGTKDLLGLPAKGDDLSVNTVLHKEGATSTTGTTFSVDLHNTVFANNLGDDMTLKVGDNEWTLTGTDGGELKGKDLVDALVAQIKADGPIEFNGQEFDVAVGTGGDNRITFTQKAAPNSADNEVSGDMKVEITSTTNSIGSAVGTGGTAAEKAVYTIDLANGDATTFAAGSKIDNVACEWDTNQKTTMEKFVAAYNADDTKDYTAAWDNDKGVLTLTAKNAGAVAGDGPTAAPALTGFGNIASTTPAVADVRTIDLTGATEAALDAKKIDGTILEWNTDLDTTMNNFVAKYNADDTKEYTAAWADGKVTLTAKTAGAVNAGNTNGAPTAAPTTDIGFTPAVKEVKAFKITAGDKPWADGDTLVVNGTTYTYDADGAEGTLNADAVADAGSLAKFIASKLSNTEYDISVNNDTILYTAKTAGTGAPTLATPTVTFTVADAGNAGTTNPSLAADNTQDVAGANAGAAAATVNNPTAGADAVTAAGAPPVVEVATEGADAEGAGVVVIGKADYNFETTAIKNVTANSGGRLASTYFDLTADMVQDGGSIKIGKDTYEFSSADADKGVAGKVYIGDLVDADGKVDIAGNLDEIANRITDAAKGNKTWTVGNTGTQMSFVEVQNQTEYTGDNALTSVENIAKTFGWTSADSTETTEKVIDEAGTGKSLMLQIGDTADDFNQLKVNIRDMHAEALGLGDDIKISDQESAAKAVDAIKAAINKVSDVRGTLGATQNRLDHTINNLSVMTENIQDAESTIRDVDVAEEMMAYTKNNILIQSAQAMLAQANQVPQGVLQLLQ